jgi:hypothetical protein
MKARSYFMATNPGVEIPQNSIPAIPPAGRGVEHTPSYPMQGKADEPQNSAGLSEEDQGRLIALVRRYKDQWSQDRMILMQRCLLNLEFFKGNQFIAFGPGNAEFFDAVGWMNENGNQHAEDSDDKDLYQYCNYPYLPSEFPAFASLLAFFDLQIGQNRANGQVIVHQHVHAL